MIIAGIRPPDRPNRADRARARAERAAKAAESVGSVESSDVPPEVIAPRTSGDDQVSDEIEIVVVGTPEDDLPAPRRG